MSLVALASAKGSPGVTTTALALASHWPHQVILLEADPAGGDLAAIFGVGEEPGLVSLAAAVRRGPLPDLTSRHCQHLPNGVAAVLAPASAERSSVSVGLLGEHDLSGLLQPDQDLVADLGRLGPAATSHCIAEGADHLVWICRPLLADLAHLARQLQSPNKITRRESIVLVGPGPYAAREVAETLGRAVIGHLPIDVTGLAALSTEPGSKVSQRSPLLRSSRSLAQLLATPLSDQDVGSVDDADLAPTSSSTDLVGAS